MKHFDINHKACCFFVFFFQIKKHRLLSPDLAIFADVASNPCIDDRKTDVPKIEENLQKISAMKYILD